MNFHDQITEFISYISICLAVIISVTLCVLVFGRKAGRR